jgi:curved DNA-binding protein CbpA
MKLDSKYFDSIRTKAGGTEAPQTVGPPCQWKGCQAAGQHRAPMGRGREGKYYLFCLDHVRQFNASYNYFEGWSSADVERFQKEAVIGHRPTWKTGLNSGAQGTPAGAAFRDGFGRGFEDPHAVFSWRSRRFGEGGSDHVRRLKPLELKSLAALDLAEGVERAQIKARFKELVKRHHPDANGGDKRSENRLREIIQAYNYLKQAGLV